MRLYETVYILRPELTEEQINQTIERLNGIINKGGGEVKNLERWGKKRLAYKIEKERYGHYILMHFNGEPDLVRELERNYRLSEDVMRYIVISIKKGEPIKVEMEREEFQEEEKAVSPAVGGTAPRREEEEEEEEETSEGDNQIEASGRRGRVGPEEEL